MGMEEAFRKFSQAAERAAAAFASTAAPDAWMYQPHPQIVRYQRIGFAILGAVFGMIVDSARRSGGWW